jgi:hypothetical protein
MNDSFAYAAARKICCAVSLIFTSLCAQAQLSYCTSGLGGSSGESPVDSVAISGTALNNSTPDNPYTYSAYPISGTTTATLQQGVTYTLAVSLGAAYYYYGGNVAMWIDYNQNGTFDTYEWVSVGTDITGTATATFTVPSAAHTGVTGLRIRSRSASEGSVYAYDACADYYSGEVEDYYVTIDSTLPCSGTPAVPAIAGPASMCYGASYTLSLSGYTYATGLTYQWKSAPSGSGTFTSVPGATGPSYTSPGLYSATDYELVVTCTASGLSSTSAISTVSLNPAYACYCHDSTLLGGGDTYYQQIDSVAVIGTTLNNYIPYHLAVYAAYPYSGSTTASLQQGATYTVVVKTGPYEYTGVGMWIDYNQNGSFDADEYVAVGTGFGTGNQVATFTVPFSAVTGETGMRIRNSDYGVYSTSACSYLEYGETEDYFITIDTTYPCSGAPVAGTVSGIDSICSATSFTLTATGGVLASGLTYQWLSSPSGEGTYTAVSGATGNALLSSGITASTDFELVVTCTASGLTDTSAPFTINELPFYRCYCHDSTLLGGGETFYEQVDSVSIVGTTLNNYTPSHMAIYSSYPASGSTTAALQQGSPYTIVVQTSEFESSVVGMWIDYNHNGAFDADEYTMVGPYSGFGNHVSSFTVPFAALAGETGMRIRVSGDGFGSIDACTYLYNGETEDYILTVDTTYPCAGTPTAGTIVGIDSICSATAYTLTATGSTLATGLTYQWLSRATGSGTFTALPAATSRTYSASGITGSTDFELVVSCTSSGLSDTSATYTLYQFPFYRCYCDSATLGGSSSYLILDSVAIAGTTLNNYTPDNYSTYSSYPPSGSTTAALQQGGTYTIIVNSGSYPYGGEAGVGLWIDYNHNGTFETSEYTLVGVGSLGDQSASFTVPLTAITGLTGMRVRNTEYDMSSTYACAYLYYGETEDYIISIDTTYPCSGTPVAGTVSSVDSVCPSVVFTVSASGYTVATGLSLQWLSRPAGGGTYTAIAGATGPSMTVYGQAAATDYKLDVTCTASGLSDTSAAFTVQEFPFYECYCDSASLGGSTYYGLIDSVAISGTTLNNYTPYTSAVYRDFPATGATTATLQQGEYYTVYVSTGTTYYYGYENYVGMWIDYDHSGTFDASEWVSAGTSVSGTTSASFYVPLSAHTGETGLRVRSTSTAYYEPLGAADACTFYESGTTEDYTVTIDTALPCTGTPTAGTISGVTSICPNDTLTLSVAGFTNAAGITLQWASRPAGSGTFTAITGATTPSYTVDGFVSATDYEVIVTCTGSSSSATTATFTVNLNSFTTCYCSPSNGTTLVGDGAGENELSRVRISGTTFNDAGIYVPYTTGYVLVSPSVTSHTAILKVDSVYDVTIIIDSNLYYPSQVGLWIDFDHSGTYDLSEYVPFTNYAYGYGTYTGTIYVPVTALTGQTGMRIESSDYYNILYACSNIYQGEVADFTVSIDTVATVDTSSFVPAVARPLFSVKAYPNPASSQVTVQTYGVPGNDATIILSDVTGRVIRSLSVAADKTVVSMDELPSGIYLIKYEDDQHTSVIKVTKQ